MNEMSSLDSCKKQIDNNPPIKQPNKGGKLRITSKGLSKLIISKLYFTKTSTTWLTSWMTRASG
jgi:hypothetical protein